MSGRKLLNVLFLVTLLVSLVAGASGSALAQSEPRPLAASAGRVAAAPISPTDESKVPHYFGPWPNWAMSPFTVPDVVVTIDPPPSGTTAEATATVGANGAVTGITITNPGSGYTSTPMVNITGGGSGATADAVLTTDGIVAGITVDTNGNGSGYKNPYVVITGGGATTDATATAYGGVDLVTLTNAGSGYTMPTVEFDLPNDPSGTHATGHVVCVEANCIPNTDSNGNAIPVTITGVQVDNPGSGYSSAPRLAIRDGTTANPINNRQLARAEAARSQALTSPKAGKTPADAVSAASVAAVANATATATIAITSVTVDTFGAGYTSAPTVTILDSSVPGGSGATATAAFSTGGGVTGITNLVGGSGYITAGGIKKFQDGLPMLCDPSASGSCVPNNLGQYVPLAVPDTTTFTQALGFDQDADYYVIALVQHREQMNSSLPPTLLREYVQLETPANASWSKHIALSNDLLDGTSEPALMPNGSQAYAVDDPHYMGPIMQAQKDRPIRFVFYNLLPTGSKGDLFIPMDSTFMGAGMGPMDMMPPTDLRSVLDEIRNPMCDDKTDPMTRMDCFADTRASIHLHGGITPWISDGSPHQWITPANEQTGWPEGVAVRQVPDMVGGLQPAGVPDCSAGNDGCTSFYYTNQQSARLMFYHDHAWGITRLNVYAGEAAGYIIRDATEKALIDGGLIPSGADEIPLVIQDRTFVPSDAQLFDQKDASGNIISYGQDPTWDKTRWGGAGNLWYEHVYMPAQNPYAADGLSTVGRWFYGPWFWPPATPQYPAIPNPYYDPNCDLNDSTTWQYDTDPFCEPPEIPGTPNNSAGMEQFNDTPIVNGTAYPTVALEPKAYRLRILNAANDRFFNFQWYVADPNSLADPADPTSGTEVAFKASELAAAQLDPNIFPTPDTSISPAGPSWIQIGTEGGFLPSPVVVPNQPITWIIDPTRFDVGNVLDHSLLLGPAERADVIVDFSKFAGKTLILYNDAPAAFPARIATYDYYTGAPDLSPAGAPAILPGYGPNTRTIMQVKIAASTPAPAFNLTALQNAFRHHVDGSGVFESGQNPTIVGQAGYNSAYGKSFAELNWCNDPGLDGTTIPCDGFARISEQGGETFKFDTLAGSQIGVKIEPKAIHDETNSTNFEPYGRMTGNLGVEAVPATPLGQNIVLYPFVNPPTELIDATNLPTTDNITPISVASDGTQIWKLTHNGVDTHPLHFHLYDVQLLNRVTWDNIIIPPDATELGWKDTVRVSPLEDTYFAIRPIIPTFPFEIPNSIRPLSPEMPLGFTDPTSTMFNNVDPNGNPTNLIVNQLVNFGWEYMMHCHILSHEEMDMMRPQVVALPPNKPTWPTDGTAFSITGNGNNQHVVLTWNDNSINETAFVVQKTTDGTTWIDVGTSPSPLTMPDTNTRGATRSLTDPARYTATAVYQYRVVAQNTTGYGAEFPSMTVQSVSDPLIVGSPPAAPSNLTATLQAGPQVSLTWRDNATNETGFVIERSTDGGTTFVQLVTVGPRNNTGNVTFVDTSVSAGPSYVYRVAAVNAAGTSGYATSASVVVPSLPAAAVIATATAARQGNNNERVTLTWNNVANETGYTIQWSNNNFATVSGTGSVGANATTFTTGNIARQAWSFRVGAFNPAGTSWSVPIALAAAPSTYP